MSGSALGRNHSREALMHAANPGSIDLGSLPSAPGEDPCFLLTKTYMEVGKPSKWSMKLPRNRLRGHVVQQYLPNSVMDQKRTSGQSSGSRTHRSAVAQDYLPHGDYQQL